MTPIALVRLRHVVPAIVLGAVALIVAACAQTTPVPASTATTMPEPMPVQALVPSPYPELSGDLLTLERMQADPPLQGTVSTRFKFSRDGAVLAFLRSSDDDSEVLDLWTLRLPDGAPTKLARAADLADVGHAQPSEEERMALERKRVRHKGIVDYEWCGPGHDRILFPLAGQLYLMDLSGEPRATKLTQDAGAKLDPRCSPRGTFVTFVRGGDLVAVDTHSGKERKLTRGATETRTHGLAEFVAQEEMGRQRGYFWSRDESYLAYLDVDTSSVTVKVRSRIFADRTEIFSQRYPAAGEPNANVRLRVLDVARRSEVLVPLPSEDGYIARVDWSPNGRSLWVQWQSRDQRRLVLHEATAPRFKPEKVLVETDDDWVELHDDLKIFAGGDAILWSSERTGSRQAYVARRSTGWTLTPLASSPDPLAQLLAFDEERGLVLTLRATDRGRQRQLFALPLDGGEASPLSRESGWHDVAADESGAYYVDSFSSFGRPPRVTLHRASGASLVVLDDNPAAELARLARPEPEWIDVGAGDGTKLNGLLIPPQRREPGKRYPVVVYVYGGPRAQLVTKAYHRLYPLDVYLTQRGFGVFMVDGRGSGGRDRAFARALHGHVGDVEIEDQLRGAQVLRAVPWVDPDRIGIWGWSYGGYAAVMAILREDSPFKAAVAVAPVTDWRLYDTHYTERYLGMPDKEAAAYERADAVSRAGQLRRPLMLVHGMADDNVLFEHTLRLSEALQNRSQPFSLMVYPGRAHGLKGKATQLHVYRTLTTFFEEHLRTPAKP